MRMHYLRYHKRITRKRYYNYSIYFVCLILYIKLKMLIDFRGPQFFHETIERWRKVKHRRFEGADRRERLISSTWQSFQLQM